MTTRFIKFDDIDAAEDRDVKATHSSVLSFEGDAVELDLSDEHYEQVAGYVRGLIRLGTPVKPAAKPAAKPHHYPAGPVTGRKAKDSRTGAYRYLLRTWCQQYNITRSDDPNILAYKTLTGGWNIPLYLGRQFEEFLDSQEGKEWLETQYSVTVQAMREYRRTREDGTT